MIHYLFASHLVIKQQNQPLGELNQPKFILGFLLVSALATAGAFDPAQTADIANLSRWAFLLTFAGVGLRTNVREMMKQGIRPFLVGAIGEFAIAAITLMMVLAVARLYLI